MRLLICTQVIDKNHPILGFFHRWVEEFAKHCEVVHVICLQAGEYTLPLNVHIHSLGKESGQNRLKYLWRFYHYSWQLRREYDSVFVHMNQVYVLLGALLWRALRKRVALWYMHGTVSLSLRLAERLVHIIFSGSKESFRLSSKKLMVTGHGIDTDHFTPLSIQKDIDLITVGRIAPSKNLETMLELLREIRKAQPVSLTIVGAPTTKVEIEYQKQVMAIAVRLGVSDAVHWYGKVTQVELPQLLNRAKVFIHTARNGSLDKALLEAMACGVAVATTAESLLHIPGLYMASIDSVATLLSDQGTGTLSLEVARTYITNKHSILTLIPRLVTKLG